ncbi:ATP-binding protein [Thalassovita sp.]|uniref:ATP-binding protein n=1 Tax=Thalassovita sp. TaxID=1979401 RepID=UPI002881A5D4|nr:ATP-binding protein [Thalassovita sp.]MDF1801465.1 ATP-binding protein [Thalassovita sp.]
MASSRIKARWIQGVFLTSVSVFALGLLVPLWLEVTDRLEQLRTARSDTVIWTVVQLEVEYLEFEMAARALETRREEGLPELRRRFNVLYSRIGTLQQSPLYRVAITEAGEFQNLGVLVSGVEALLPLIDGPDADLVEKRGLLIQQLSALHVPTRRIVANGNYVLTTRAEVAREEAAKLLWRLGIVSLILFSGLFGLAALFSRLYVIYKRRARENLITSQRLATVVTTSPDAIIVTDADGNISDFNPAAVSLLNYEREIALTKRLSDLIRDETGQPTSLPAAQRGFFRQRMSGRTQDGSSIPLEVSQGATSFDHQRVYIYFLRNISDRLNAEEALLASRDRALAGERAKAHFLAVMSHEMRTPLNGILGVIDLMRDSVKTEKDSHYLALLERSGQILLGHVNEVLDITEIEARGINLNIAPFHLDALLDEVSASLRVAARAKGNQLTLTCDPEELGHFMGDAMRLRQIVANLLSNAIKFTSGGQIDLMVTATKTPAGNRLEIQVADTGIGIDESLQGSVFDDFVRLDRGRASQAEGTGLGLGIVRRIVTAMGGEIGVDSMKGEGSLFWVILTLPVAEQVLQTVPIEEPEGPETVGRPLNVLLVEDNATNRFVLKEMLEQDQHTVVEAENGQIGAEIARRRKFDVILMDINMPVMGGVQATRLIRSDGVSKNTRIIALTAHVLDQDTQLYREVGIDRVVSKPISRRNIYRVLRGEATEAEPGRLNKTLDPIVLEQFSQSLSSENVSKLLRGIIKEGDSFVQVFSQASVMPRSTLTDLVHEFSGSCAMIGAVRLRNTLARLESTLRRNSDEDLRPWVEPLRVLWRETRTELHAYVKHTGTA